MDHSTPMTIGCPLALALQHASEILSQYDIVEVGHMGTYNCRVIAGTASLSQHGSGLAIDYAWFRTAGGQIYDVEDHWEHDTQEFQTEAGRILYEIAQAFYHEDVFNIVLTPNYNAAHDDHLHVDLSDGGDLIGKSRPGRYIGPNPNGD